ncbi:type VI secretion system tube protein TssD [Aquimarina sp. MMG016]|uniref:type VI secretion system tube protein TssD n=1 Tax=Aquimarina sp. MMG016 TaxID=2822690 RepID=UPI001B39EB53|nr:type VI secretion system tube protein TssD [Aquimarina sp. MMG016]MBQ4819283.1 hypothetical protein [Aquimarina sp. MMG016]
MAFQAKLFINGEERNVLNSSFLYRQLIDHTGRPKTSVNGGQLHFILESTKNDELFYDWMFADHQTYQGYLRFYDRDGFRKLFDFEFANCHCVGLTESFSATGNEPLRMELTLSPGIQKVRDQIFEKAWNPNNPFKEEAVPVTTLETPQTQITRIAWVNSDSQEENITEIRVTQRASLIAEIQNPEGSTATITIEKEDGTEFDSGQKQLSFTESISSDGIVELSPFEIKEQWEEFKKADIDKLIARVQHNGSSKTSSSLKIIPKPKVLVNFRTHNNYKGEYGFDWMRMGDTGKPGDSWYKNIIGSNKTGSFVQDDKEYVKLGKKFEQLPHPIKPKDIYLVPVLSLYPNKSAKFSLKVEVKDYDAQKIEYKFDDTLFTLSKKEVSHKTVGKKTLPDDLEIKCIKEFSTDQYIEVLADGEFAGKLKVIANDKTNRYKTNVVFVKVKTDLSGSGRPKATVISGRDKELNKYMIQALAKPSYNTVELDLSTDSTFNTNFSNGSTLKNAGTDAFQDHLNTALASGIKKDYSDYYKIYFINEEDGGLYGRAYDIPAPKASRSVIVLKPGLTDSTLAHEAFHAMGLYHSFDDDGEFTFEQNKTDNIMDYSDIATPPIPVISTWQWQWGVLHKNLDKE